jgi:hypothetical protein
MATRTPTISRITSFGDRAHVISWSGLLNGDDGAPIEMPGSSDRSVQLLGTLGAAGSCRIEGSNDGTTYHVLSDPQGNALDITSLKIETVLELVRFIRPRVTAGDGTTNLALHMLVKR